MTPTTIRRLVRGAIITLILLGIAGAAAWWTQRPADPAASYASAIGGPFRLTGADGRPFGSADLRGKPYAIFFGFTRCPDICPSTLARLAQLRRQLGAEDGFEIVFVSVDPEEDSPEAVGRYVEMFGTPIIGLAGNRSQVDQAARAFSVIARRVPTGANAYTIEHTASVFLMGPRGEFVSTVDVHEDDDVALAKLRRLIAA